VLSAMSPVPPQVDWDARRGGSREGIGVDGQNVSTVDNP
jgi:hypothetical protein